ncbi:MAG TPA: BamA/TamA family outer membrane protein [Myxococcales bacterium]
MGNVWSQSEDFFGPQPHVGPLNLLHTVGLGIRWFSPIGPLRFEWGFPLTRLSGDAPFLLDLAIGACF